MATCPSCRKRYANDVTVCEIDGETLLPEAAFTGVDPDLAPGTVVGEYQIENKIGEGGFGAVYRAFHPLIGKTAAIKVLNRQYSSNPQMVSRFIAEARAVNQIRNRNIIDIFSFGSLEDGRQYYLMELLEGMTFDKYIKQKGRLTVEEAIPIFRGIARALDAAHANGIAHRDLKPENVFLVFDDDGTVFPKLLDFGIAKLMGESTMSGHKTRTGTPMGTPHYMSPEQCRGKNVDHRTDVYSFGILVHECLTGRLPFDGEEVMDLLFKHTTAPPPRLTEHVPGLPAALDAPVAHMLEKDPNNRPQSVSEAVEALARAAEAAGLPVQAAPPRVSRKSGDGSGPQVVSGAPRGLTPSEVGAFVDARTLLGKQTLSAAETDVPKPAGNRSVIYGALMALLVGSAIGTAFFMRSRSPATAVTSGLPAPTEAAPTQAAVADTAPTAAAPLPADVDIMIRSKPATADVFLGDAKLGAAGSPLRLKRGDAEVTLTVKSPGYKPLDVKVTPSANLELPVTLERVAAATTKKGKPEIEF